MNDKTLHCLVQYVDEGQKVLSNNVNETKSKVNFINVIEWLTFVESESGWGLDRVRKFAFFGGIDYIMLKHASGEGERSDDAYFMCITDKPFKLIYDSAGMMLEDEIENGKVEELLQDKKKVSYAHRNSIPGTRRTAISFTSKFFKFIMRIFTFHA